MKTKLLYLWDKLRSSFWFIPTCIIIAVIATSFFVIYLDSKTSYLPEGFIRYVFSGSVDSARSVLSIIAGAMIGVAGTVFSITLVVLTLASSQLGPRLLRNFMYDRLNQVVLGAYVSTFIYCLLILNAVEDSESLTFLPVISVLVAIVLVIINMFLLIIFIHHIAVSIQSDKVVSNITSTLTKHIKEKFKEKKEEEAKNVTVISLDIEDYKDSYNLIDSVKSQKSGYLQSVDVESLIDCCEQQNILIEIHHKPGDFLVENLDVVNIYTSEKCADSIKEHILESFIIGDIRTPLQDSKYRL